jgi:2-oxoglutarate dehydrogenase E2 component (dihydrolipoamide succinyltransferase)
MTDINVPALGESVSTATVARWLKRAGEAVAADEPLVELETDKVTVEVNAPSAGILGEIAAEEGAEVEVGALLGSVEADAIAAAPSSRSAKLTMTAAVDSSKPKGTVPPPPSPDIVTRPPDQVHAPFPAAAKIMEERQLNAAQIGAGSGKGNRITKGDVLAFTSEVFKPPGTVNVAKESRPAHDGEERVKMTRLRRTIAARLKEAQNTAAMLTTFNEVDMSACIALRTEYKDAFEKKHGGVRLGYMGFFVRSCITALQEFPSVNAEIDEGDIVYKHFVHMGIAVGGANGLVVPVIRHAERLSLAQIEKAVSGYGKAARDGTLKIDDLAGGTFSITNGGVYGSLMSTPILNPPQSAILGMHKIQDRPIAVAGKIEIRPMMYLALSYDHRIIDGKEAVSFLVRVKESIEDPRRLVLGI